MKKSFAALIWIGIASRLFVAIAAAQPSVYSGVYANGEGDLTSASDLQAITNFVNEAQKDISIINNFDSWTDTPSSTNGTRTFPTTEMKNIRSHGSIPMFTWQPENGAQGTSQSFNLANIVNGAYDAYIANWAASAKAWGHPFFLRFSHEMNGNWYPWCAGVNGNTSAQYVQAWQHVHDIFTNVGATNVTWVWCVNVVFSGSTPIAGLYPGDNYVDWLGVDGYNRLANPWQDFSLIADPTLTQLTNIAPGKPIMVAETGCNQTNNPTETKAQWFVNALTNYLPAQPRIKAWVYFNSTNATDGNDWRINVPSSAVTGYQQAIALSYYDSNRYAAILSSPIQPLLNDVTTPDTMPPFVSILSPATGSVTSGTVVNVTALASDKSGISNVVFSVNGVPQQTNYSPPYQYSWSVPFAWGVTNTLAATACDNAGNNAASAIQVSSQEGAATNILQTVTEASPMDWDNTAIWGSPTALASNGNNYETPSTFIVRTPNSITPAAFAGNSLQVDSGGTLDLKNGGQNSGNAAVVNLVLNGGIMNFHGGFAPNGPAVAGTVLALAASSITTDQTGSNAADIWVQSPLSGSGNLTVDMKSTTNSLILSGNNFQYSGNWTNASIFGNIKISGGTTNALGSGSVSLVNPNGSLILASTNALALNNAISGAGSLVKQNSNTVTLNGSNSFAGPVQIKAGVLQLGATGSISGAASIEIASNAVLNVGAVPGGFAVAGTQTLAGVGSVTGNVTVIGAVSPGPLGTLSFSNALVLAGTAVMELNRTNFPNADLLVAAAVTFGGTLTVTNIGAALQAGDSFQLFSGELGGAFAATNLPALSPNTFWDVSLLQSRGIIKVASIPARPTVIISSPLSGTNLTLQVSSSQAGFNYVLQTTFELFPASWNNIHTNPGTGGT